MKIKFAKSESIIFLLVEQTLEFKEKLAKWSRVLAVNPDEVQTKSKMNFAKSIFNRRRQGHSQRLGNPNPFLTETSCEIELKCH